MKRATAEGVGINYGKRPKKRTDPPIQRDEKTNGCVRLPLRSYGQVFVGITQDLKGTQNSMRFQLNLGSYRHRKWQNCPAIRLELPMGKKASRWRFWGSWNTTRTPKRPTTLRIWRFCGNCLHRLEKGYSICKDLLELKQKAAKALVPLFKGRALFHWLQKGKTFCKQCKEPLYKPPFQHYNKETG